MQLDANSVPFGGLCAKNGEDKWDLHFAQKKKIISIYLCQN